MHLHIEEDLFESLFRREYPGVVAAARRVVGSAVAEDIAQEAFAALFRSGPNDALHARNWLYRTTLHRAISSLRSERRRQARETGMPVQAATGDEPLQHVERLETQAAVQTVLSRMHERYAMVLALRHSGLSYKEIGAVMEIKVNQVGTLLVRAEAAFKKELDRVPSR